MELDGVGQCLFEDHEDRLGHYGMNADNRTTPFTGWFQLPKALRVEELSFSLLDSDLQVVVYELFKFGLLGSQRGPSLACLRARGGSGLSAGHSSA